jgi:hypothetical protein
VTTPRWDASLQASLVLTIIAFLLGELRWGAPFRRIGLFALGVTYYAAHIVDLGVDVLPSIVFLTSVLVQIELRFLADRFAPLYERAMHPSARRRIDAALARALLRLGVAAALGVLVPILAADLALAGLVPTTSIATAVFLAVGLVAVIVVMALLPTMQRESET